MSSSQGLAPKFLHNNNIGYKQRTIVLCEPYFDGNMMWEILDNWQFSGSQKRNITSKLDFLNVPQDV